MSFVSMESHKIALPKHNEFDAFMRWNCICVAIKIFDSVIKILIIILFGGAHVICSNRVSLSCASYTQLVLLAL